MTEKKTGVYLCQGCGIGGAVSAEALEQLVTGDLHVANCTRHAALCSDEGRAAIAGDIAGGDVNQAIIAACSPRVMADRFIFPGVQTVRVNLREQVAWTQPAGDEDTQALAADNIRMGVAQAAKMEPPMAHDGGGAANNTLLVLGGGVTGLTAAREAVLSGLRVILVEKTGALGGWTRKWSKVIPHRPPYRDPQPNNIEVVVAGVECDPAVTVLTDTIVTRTVGGPGEFTVTLSTNGSERTEVVGAIVVATGWRPYDTAVLEPLGYGKSPDIVTDIEFEALLVNGGVKRPSDGKAADNLAFIISGETGPMAFSSGLSDRIAIKQALQVVAANPEAMIYVMHEHLRAHGTAEEFYRQAQESGIVFQNATVKSVADDLTVTVEDHLLGEEVAMSGLDMVVLSTGMVPNTTNVDLDAAATGAGQLADDIDPAAPFAAAGDDSGAGAGTGNGEDAPVAAALPGGPILNLQYSQGPHLPILADGFADSHFICFPYETRRTGIHTCGPVRRAMTIAEARQDAQGAVLKAMQAMRAADEAVSVHPRVGDLSFPEFGLDICTKCRRCTVECPFGAIDEQEDGYPVLNATRCRRCGTCMGACPVRTINFKNYNVQMIADMIKAVDIPDEFEEKPRILVLACENDAYPALDMAGINRHQLSPFVRIIPVRCLGSVTMLWISTALECGYDGVMLLGCKSGDDYQCHFVKGSAIAKERMANVRTTLQSMMLEEQRVQVREISIADSGHVTEVLNAFTEEIVELGFNPFKGL